MNQRDTKLHEIGNLQLENEPVYFTTPPLSLTLLNFAISREHLGPAYHKRNNIICNIQPRSFPLQDSTGKVSEVRVLLPVLMGPKPKLEVRRVWERKISRNIYKEVVKLSICKNCIAFQAPYLCMQSIF
jgi:hypothetical protein